MSQRRPGTTVESVYQTLRERIIEGEMLPGTRMSQDGLATELNVSRTPLREALHRLEADGLVVSEANRGMEVAPISDSHVEQCYAIRLLVEPPTMAAVAHDLTDGDLDAMEAALEEMDATSQRIRDFQEAHLRFHTLALRRYPAAVREMTESLHLQIYRHQRLHFSRPHVPEHFTQVDRTMLQALRSHDERSVRQVLQFHLIDAAVGMILDKNPDYRFDALLVSARGLGIELEQHGDGQLPRPAKISWPRGGNETSKSDGVVAMSTTNLEVVPPQRGKHPTKGDAA